MLRRIAISTLLVGAAGAATAPSPTFYKDVLPVLQQKCQNCHRPGEAAPMSFLEYKTTRPWAKAIKAAVQVRKMPPWLADPHYGKFANDYSLSEVDRNTLVAWVDAGAAEGTPRTRPSQSPSWRAGTLETRIWCTPCQKRSRCRHREPSSINTS